MKRILMIAYHFPPFAGSSGVQRTLRFVQQLPAFGWLPVVLTVQPRAFEKTSPDLLADVPPQVEVHRAFALDTARHLALKGRYPSAWARPDRWCTWWLGAVPKGLSLVRRHRPDAIWSTYPIATAHRIGATLHRMTGVPWVADFRDPMAQEGYPEDPKTWEAFAAIERSVVPHASRSVFTTRGALGLYAQRFPGHRDRLCVIENGFDEESFGTVKSAAGPLIPGKVTLLHSGLIYPVERDPTAMFRALAMLRNSGAIAPRHLCIRFRASAHDPLILRLAEQAGVSDFVECAPPVPYREALGEMLRADGLLVMQAANCNEQIPAKVYEYIRAGRPVLGLTDPPGDTADLLARAGVRHVAPLESTEAIAATLVSFLQALNRGDAPAPKPEVAAQFSRLSRTRELAGLLDSIAGR